VIHPHSACDGVSLSTSFSSIVCPGAYFHGSDHRFQLKAINDFILGDHHRSEATQKARAENGAALGVPERAFQRSVFMAFPFRIDSPFSSTRCALCTRRSSIPSATVASPICSYQLVTGMVDFVPNCMREDKGAASTGRSPGRLGRLHHRAKMTAYAIAARIPGIGQAADRSLIRKLARQLARYVHAEFTTNADTCRPAHT
jgi:hypothetical protein